MTDRAPAPTDWFDPATAPAREGVYERVFAGGRYACWNGRAWNADAPTPHEAASQTAVSARQHVPWRGLAEPAAAPCATCKGHTIVDRGFDADTARDLIDECPDC